MTSISLTSQILKTVFGLYAETILDPNVCGFQ